MYAENRHVMEVSELTRQVRFILESELRTVWLTGEISNFIAASSGHWYFSLKDAKSQVRCAMFKNSNRHVQIKPENGTQVLVKATVSLYEPRGDFQLIIEQMEAAGDGLLRQKFELLKKQLAAKGLFDLAVKKPLPKYVNTLGVVTSATGAAIKDIISVLKRRQPGIKVIIYPALVQGESAAASIADMIMLANKRNECDVLIVGRGGGSMEDLWAFNEVPVVNAIYQSRLPVISAVGHEIDHSLADLAADVRAATPSAAAELISQDNEQASFLIHQQQNRLKLKMTALLNQAQVQLNHLQHRLQQTHPERQLLTQQQKLDQLQRQLLLKISAKLSASEQLTNSLSSRLNLKSPQFKLTANQEHLQALGVRLHREMNSLARLKQEKLSSMAQQLHLVSPLATIARGYTVTRNASGDIVKHSAQVNIGEEITTQTNNAQLTSIVTKIDEA